MVLLKRCPCPFPIQRQTVRDISREREELKGMTCTLPVRLRFRRMSGDLFCDLEEHKSAPASNSTVWVVAERAWQSTVLQRTVKHLTCQLFSIAHACTLVLAQAAPVKAYQFSNITFKGQMPLRQK